MKRLYFQCVLVLLFLVVPIACSGQAATPADVVDSASQPVSELPACAKAGPATSLPAEFPADFPLPPGTAIQASRNTEQGVLIVDSIVPVDLQSASAFFVRELPDAGFTLGFGDGEFDEAESAFSGNGYQGHFKVHTIQDCPGVVTLTVALTKQ